MGYHIGSLEVLKSLQMYDSSDQRSRRFPSVFGDKNMPNMQSFRAVFLGLEGLEGFGRKVHSGYSFNMFYCFFGIYLSFSRVCWLAGYEPIGATMTKRY